MKPLNWLYFAVIVAKLQRHVIKVVTALNLMDTVFIAVSFVFGVLSAASGSSDSFTPLAVFCEWSLFIFDGYTGPLAVLIRDLISLTASPSSLLAPISSISPSSPMAWVFFF